MCRFYLILVGLMVCCTCCVKAQELEMVVLQFQPMYKNQSLLSEASSHEYKGKSINFSRLKFYLTSIELWENEQLVWKEPNSYHLLDAEELNTLQLTLNVPKQSHYNQVKFCLGIDSLTNVSGAMGGDLDPTKGMYWAWNSGYINFKLEGQSEWCPARKNKFQFHLGGYAGLFNSQQVILLPLKKQPHTTVTILVEKFLEAIDLEVQHSIMSPSEEAVLLAQRAATIFYINEEN